ncbi:hypothetical protein KY284_001140 [Solanum tuberosum]|nr:hypothetical protein KY284_001140 [Solanum tuberosum]
MDELRDKRKREEGHVEAEAQGEGENGKLKGNAKLLLAEYKEIRGDPHEALVMDAFVVCPNIPTGVSFEGKNDLSCGRQGAIAKFNTFTIANELSVNVSLSICELIVSVPCIDNVLVESVDTLVNPIDYQIDSSSTIGLCPPRVDTCTLNASSLSCDDCVDQPVCEGSSLVEGPCNVAKEPQVSGTNDIVDQLNMIDSMNIYIMEDPIASFAHRDHVLERASKIDMCLFESELECFNYSLVVDHSHFKYNILLGDDKITPSDVPSGVKLESSVVLNNYIVYSNPLWCESFPPKNENLFLKNESTLVGKECDEEEGGVGFPITSSSWCVSILYSMTNTFEPIGSHTHGNTLEESGKRSGPGSWISFPSDPGSEFNCGTCVVMLGQDKKYHLDGFVDNFPYDGNSFLRVYNPIDKPTLCMGKGSFLSPFIYSCFEYDVVDRTFYRGRRSLLGEGEVYFKFAMKSFGINGANESLLDSMLYFSFPFDLGVGLNCDGYGSNTLFLSCEFYLVLLPDPMCLNEVTNPWLKFVMLGYMLTMFVHPWHGDEIVIANANPHAMRILFLFAPPRVLQGMDSRTNPFQEGENDVKWITSSLSIHELQCFDGVFTRMEVVWHVWMPMRKFHALHRNICTLKELTVGPLASVPGSPTDPISCKRKLPIRRAWRTFGTLPIDPRPPKVTVAIKGEAKGAVHIVD